MEAAIQLKNVSKTMNKKTIIDSISLDVYPGEIFGLLGPNGAGKTTTIRMIVGLMKTSAGEIHIQGQNLAASFENALKHIGAVVENPEMYDYLTGRENLIHYQRMMPGVTKERIEEVTALVGMSERINEPVGNYSLGMRQRLGLAQALLHQPAILILDEPTNGLDPAGIQEIRAYLRYLAEEENVCIVVSSHLLAEMEKMCDRIGVLQHGKLIQTAEIGEFTTENNRVCFKVSHASEAAEQIRHAFGYALTVKDTHIDISMSEKEVPDVVQLLVSGGFSVYQVKPAGRSTLEEKFLTITGGDS
ncbi:ABC transporter ATP-binding protein [Salisediminibacterium halotolerans]|uniref:ABC-2 type transport system ATP-binding protein n=1 Tax=Salisediminibacterium halotolerans TaxID=517425 RepID=A0A1H9RUT2_9BACI|nr:ABC transporter ATP-binding protein [Salisediminibacterium haloalkalitolerans]SER76620.1 ABC-2 type transport system ATP-binding protein [Salisediminibacterium haloalkalitolerans]